MFPIGILAAFVVSGFQTPQAASGNEGRFHAELRTESERFGNSCGFELKKIPGCASLLLTDHPIHVAVGSIAPQNGLAWEARWSHTSRRARTGGSAGTRTRSVRSAAAPGAWGAT